MRVTAEHKVDAGEQGSDGLYEYYYAYTDFTIEAGELTAGFRLYDNESQIFLSWIADRGVRKTVKWGLSFGSDAIAFPSESVEMARVLSYFRDTHGVREVSAYDGSVGSYRAVPLESLV
jgi:hypothetical protein